MDLKDQKQDFIDIYEQRISWSSQAERWMFEKDVDDLIFAARKEQLKVDCDNLITKLNDLTTAIARVKKEFKG